MSFIIAVILIFIIGVVKLNESAATAKIEAEIKEERTRYKAWEERNTDNELKWRLRDYIDDEKNYDAVQYEMQDFLNIIPGFEEYVKDGFPLYPYQFLGTAKQRVEASQRYKDYAVMVLMANRGKAYHPTEDTCDCNMLKKLVFVEPKARIDKATYIARYKWYEEALIKGGMSREDAMIYYIPPVSRDHDSKKLVVQDVHPVAVGARFNFAHNLTNDEKQRAQRLWEINYDELMSQKYERERRNLINILNLILELEIQTRPM